MTKLEATAKLKSIDLQVKVGSRIAIFAWIFWVLETILFTVLYGWHTEAINTVERVCDNLFIISLFIGIGIIFSANSQMTKFMQRVLSEDLNSK